MPKSTPLGLGELVSIAAASDVTAGSLSAARREDATLASVKTCVNMWL